MLFYSIELCGLCYETMEQINDEASLFRFTLYLNWAALVHHTWDIWGHGISRGIEESMWKFQWSIKQKVEFPGVFKKNSCGISMGLGFSPWNFQGMSQNFA